MVQIGRVVTALALRRHSRRQVNGHTFERMTAPVVALTHARVIDGSGKPAREDQTLVVTDGRTRR